MGIEDSLSNIGVSIFVILYESVFEVLCAKQTDKQKPVKTLPP